MCVETHQGGTNSRYSRQFSNLRRLAVVRLVELTSQRKGENEDENGRAAEKQIQDC